MSFTVPPIPTHCLGDSVPLSRCVGEIATHDQRISQCLIFRVPKRSADVSVNVKDESVFSRLPTTTFADDAY